MKKQLWLIIGIAFIAVLGILLWLFFFDDSGILATGYKFFADIFNGFAKAIFGDSAGNILPTSIDPSGGTDTDVTNPFE